jgi:hypothetical protein
MCGEAITGSTASQAGSFNPVFADPKMLSRDALAEREQDRRVARSCTVASSPRSPVGSQPMVNRDAEYSERSAARPN